MGDNWQFATIYSMDTAFSRRDALGSREDAQAEIETGEICGSLPAGLDRKAYATRPWKISSFVHDGEWIYLGGHRLQIVATPGHTPDAIALFDPVGGLLFTGDTYYPGTIWLYRPETDLAAYNRSVRRLAALAPQVKEVLGSHNVPVASPAVLPQLVVAFEAVMAHKVQPLPAGDKKVTYTLGEISFLMRAPGRWIRSPQYRVSRECASLSANGLPSCRMIVCVAHIVHGTSAIPMPGPPVTRSQRGPEHILRDLALHPR